MGRRHRHRWVQCPVRVLLLSLPDTKNASTIPYWSVLIFILKCQGWTTINYAVIEWGGKRSDSCKSSSARDIQQKRFTKNGSSDIVCNVDVRVREIRQFCKLQDEGQSLMRAAMTQLSLSARAYHRILKLARTIADLKRSEEIQPAHLAEVLHTFQRL
jgi:hypothetical protein